jgi:hypothetical protein
MENRRSLRIELLVPISYLLLASALIRSASAQAPGDWWPDPATHRGLSVWLAYSREYDDIYRDLDQDPIHQQLVEEQLADLQREGMEVVFVALSSSAARPHLQSLSNREILVTRDVRSFLNRLSSRGIRACAAILSIDFTDDDPAMLDRYMLVDHLLDYNANLDPADAPFRCVATDLEMSRGYRRAAVYDLWKQFHLNMKNRIQERSSGLALLTWMQGPDYLLSQMSPADRDELMTREGITSHPTDAALYIGAIRYFTTQKGRTLFEAVIPMWYFAPRGPYARRLQHNFDELQGIPGEKPFLIAGIMHRNDTGLCCVDDLGNPVCIRTRTEYDGRLDFNDTFRNPPSIFIGTGVFKWPVPAQWDCTVAASDFFLAPDRCGG